MHFKLLLDPIRGGCTLSLMTVKGRIFRIRIVLKKQFKKKSKEKLKN